MPTLSFCEVLERATNQERTNYGSILRCEPVVRSIISSFEELTRGREDCGSYDAVVRQVAILIGLLGIESDSTPYVERRIVMKLFNQTWEKMSARDRELFAAEWNALAAKNPSMVGIASVGAFSAAIMGAQISGFGIYVLAASTVGAVTGFFGMTLPFLAYMGLSKLISVAIGPVGWAIALYSAAKEIARFQDKKAWNKLTAVVLLTAAVRARIEDEDARAKAAQAAASRSRGRRHDQVVIDDLFPLFGIAALLLGFVLLIALLQR